MAFDYFVTYMALYDNKVDANLLTEEERSNFEIYKDRVLEYCGSLWSDVHRRLAGKNSQLGLFGEPSFLQLLADVCPDPARFLIAKAEFHCLKHDEHEAAESMQSAGSMIFAAGSTVDQYVDKRGISLSACATKARTSGLKNPFVR